MTFGTAIATCFRKYAEFTGRAGRPEFWWFVLFTVLVSAALGTIDSAIYLPFSTPGEALVGTPTQYDVAWNGGHNVLENLWGLAVLLPSLAVTVRRLRDTGRHWGNVFWILLPIAGLIVLIVYLSQPGVVEPHSESGAAPTA